METYGQALRRFRTERGLSLRALAQLLPGDHSYLSQIERGVRRGSGTIAERCDEALGAGGELIAAYDLCAAAQAVVSSDAFYGPPGPPGPRVGPNPMREGDPMRRRNLLSGVAGLAGLSIVGPAPGADAEVSPAPTAQLVAELQQRLMRLHPNTATPTTVSAVRAMLTTTRSAFQASNYLKLATDFPHLIDTVEATHAATNGDDSLALQAIRAEMYTAAAETLIKVGELGLAWMTIDRAMSAAESSGDTLAQVEATRTLCILNRKAEHYDTAVSIAVQAADRLDHNDPVQLSMHGALLSTAGYTAAQSGDRERSNELLDEASAAASRLDGRDNLRHTAFSETNVRLFRITASWALGDSGTAIAHAKTVDIRDMKLPERRARYWIDVARAFSQWGKLDQTYRALLAAEREAAQEVHARPVVTHLIQNLLSAPTHPSGLREFAARNATQT